MGCRPNRRCCFKKLVKFKHEFSTLRNIEEKKQFYIKYLLDDDYTLTENDIYNIKTLNIKKKYYFNEEANNNFGETLISNNKYIDNLLPTYIIFKNKNRLKKRWAKINKIIDRTDLSSRNSLKILSDKESFTEFINNTIYNNDIQREHIHINIYGDSIEHKSIYKKLKVKYDFYYVNLEEYETIKTKINFLKTKQILEILGAELIIIDRQHLSNTLNSHIVGITNYSVNETIESTNENKNNEKFLDIYKYKIRKGFFSSVDDFLKKVDKDTYILYTREEIDNDFELKSLIGARIEKSLKEFNKVIYESKISNKEIKIDLLLKQSYGFNLKFKKYNNNQRFLKIKAVFYGVEKLYCLDEIPLTYEGFKILNDMENEAEKRKYIENFYIRVLRKNNYISQHIEKIEQQSEDTEIHGRQYYKNLINNINSFFNIEQLLECLRGPNDVKLNSEGFDILRICTINREPETYKEYKKNFCFRVLKSNNISIEKFTSFVTTFKKVQFEQFIEKKIKSFESIKKYILEYLSNISFCSIDEAGYFFVFSNIIYKNNAEKKKILFKFIKKYLENDLYMSIEDYELIVTRIEELNEKIEIIYELDFFSFRKLLEFIVNKNYREVMNTLEICNTTPIRNIMTPEIIINDNIENNKDNELLCMYGMN